MLSDDDSPPSSSRLLHCATMNSYGVDDQIANLLNSLRLSSLRHKVPHDGDEQRLKKLHHQLEWLVNGEGDEHRRRRLRHILPAANCVREQVLVLRRFVHNVCDLSSEYVTSVHAALTAIMKESFEEEYRKLATVVGILEAVAELLILEVDAFGIDCPNENRTIRKLIASTLTNLTFGNAQSKRRLCTYPTLIEYVVKIVNDSHSLAQVYAGLLRNLSWMADAEMSGALSPSVPALCRASLCAYHAVETKCLCATLSALWNLASHSRDNKKAICDEPGLLDMLIELLTNDAKQTVIVESASGILKYASMYLAVVGVEQYLSVAALHLMLFRLIDLLNSASFTIIGNSLGVLSQLLAKNHQLRSHLRTNQKAMQLFNHLRNSTREDIRNPIRTVMSYLNSVDMSYGPSYSTGNSINYRMDGMSSSYGGPAPSYYDSPRLLKLRSSNQTPCKIGNDNSSGVDPYFLNSTSYSSTVQHGFAPRPGDRSHQQYASLPRQLFQHSKHTSASTSRDSDQIYFAQQNPTTFSPQVVSPLANANQPLSNAMSAASTSGLMATNCQNLVSESVENQLRSLNLRSDDPSFDVEDSVRCTRCTSTQSLSSLLPGERSAWDSCNNSAAESNRLSPLSATDIPDSPTQCGPESGSTTLSNCDQDPDGEDKPSSNNPTAMIDKKVSNYDSNSATEGAKSSAFDKRIQDSTPADSVNDDGDYSSLSGRVDSELLNQSIEAVMPKRIEINEDFLAEMIEQAQPKHQSSFRQIVPSNTMHFSRASTAKIRSASGGSKNDDEDFLMQSIASVLPPAQSTRSPTKKVRAMIGDTAHLSGGPKSWNNAATAQLEVIAPLVVSTASSKKNRYPEKSNDHFVTRPANNTLSNELFDAALYNSSFVESVETQEKVRDASWLKQQHTSNKDSDILSEDSYSPASDRLLVLEKGFPMDVDEEFQADQLIIDCNVVSETTKQTIIKSVAKVSGAQSVQSHLSTRTDSDLRSNSDQDSCILPAPLSTNDSSMNSSDHSARIASCTKNAPKSASQNVIKGKSQLEKFCPPSSQASALPRPKFSNAQKVRYNPQSRSFSSSRKEAQCSKQNRDTDEVRQARSDQRASSTGQHRKHTSSSRHAPLQKLAKVSPFNHRSNDNNVLKENGCEKTPMNVDNENIRSPSFANRVQSKKKTVNQIFVTTV